MGICHETQKKSHKKTIQSECTMSQNQTSDKTPINSTQLTQKEKILNRLSYKTNYSEYIYRKRGKWINKRRNRFNRKKICN